MPKSVLLARPEIPAGEPQYATGPSGALADFITGLSYFPTEPVPKDVGKAYGVGALLGNAPMEMLKLLGVAAPLVAAGGPKMIPLLRENGLQKVEQAANQGLHARIMNEPHTVNPPTPMNLDAKEALKFAQQRYPRLMGHSLDIGDIDLATKYANPHLQINGQSQSISPTTVMKLKAPGTEQGVTAEESVRMARLLSDKTNVMGLNPDHATPATIGHELLHNADRITMPDFDRGYEFSLKLPGVGKMSPYEASSYEVRARNMGDSFARDFANYNATDPNAPWSARLKEVKDKARGKVRPKATKAQEKAAKDPWQRAK